MLASTKGFGSDCRQFATPSRNGRTSDSSSPGVRRQRRQQFNICIYINIYDICIYTHTDVHIGYTACNDTAYWICIETLRLLSIRMPLELKYGTKSGP